MGGTVKCVYEFGPFRLDAKERLLWRDGNALPLTSKLCDTLLLLVENSGHLLLKDELMKSLWPNSFVEEVNLSQNISRLRKLLGETPDQQYIATIAGQGYRFIADVREVSDGTKAPDALVIESHTRDSVVVEEEEEDDQGDGKVMVAPALPAGRNLRQAYWLIPIALVVATLVWFSLRPITNPVSDSIAVLPFDTSSSDREMEYLADGITESTIDHLSRSPNLKVVSLGSVLRYRRLQATPQEVGRELGVRKIMMGKIVIQQERMMLLTELIDTTDGTHIWGQQYNRKVGDVIEVQEDLATEIAAKLQLRETPEQQNLFRKRYSQDFEAYKLYVRGRYYWNKRNSPDLQRGLSYFQQAIDRDPTYALAYAGLADAYFVESAAGMLPTREGMPKAKAAAMTALQLDDSLAEAHASLAQIRFTYDWNWTEAEAEYKRSIKLSPSYSYAHYYYGTFLLAMARDKEAFAELQQAQELDPFSPMIATFIGKGYYFDKDKDRTIAQFRKVLSANPGFPPAASFLIETLERTGSFQEALSTMDINDSGRPDPNSFALHHAYETAGASGYLHERIRQIQQSPQGDAGGMSGGSAALYAVLGEKDNAFRMLEQAYDRHEAWLIYLKVDPVWDNLRRDFRFPILLHRVGLA
jgi:TolB-like protein/DNA-binding winged helix-turn-helix (wHTH) protein/Tfp pilus assembly protein PilF